MHVSLVDELRMECMACLGTGICQELCLDCAELAVLLCSGFAAEACLSGLTGKAILLTWVSW